MSGAVSLHLTFNCLPFTLQSLVILPPIDGATRRQAQSPLEAGNHHACITLVISLRPPNRTKLYLFASLGNGHLLVSKFLSALVVNRFGKTNLRAHCTRLYGVRQNVRAVFWRTTVNRPRYFDHSCMNGKLNTSSVKRSKTPIACVHQTAPHGQNYRREP